MAKPTFAGKFSLASVDNTQPTVFATPYRLDDTTTATQQEFPAMAASQADVNETWIAYATDTGLILQMGDLKYLTPDDEVGTVMASADVHAAARFQWTVAASGAVPTPTTTPTNTGLSIAVPGGGWEPLRYALGRGVPHTWSTTLSPTMAGNPNPRRRGCWAISRAPR